MITDTQADYLIVLVEERIGELERRALVAVTSQEEHEIAVELMRAKAVCDALRR